MSLKALLNQPVSKDDVAKAVRVIIRTGNVSPIVLQRHLKLGYSKSNKIIAMLQGAGIVSAKTDDGPRKIIIKHEEQAVNAALRRFNKGKRARK